VNHADMRVKDMDAAIAWYRAVLGFDLIDGPVQARVRPRRLIHCRKVLG
jgi:catechol 2,3-dioxygenase-like lactoylglutathione lyase family enzyme